MYTCQNQLCRKDFSSPLKTLNLQLNATEPYDACPYCLTKVEEKPQMPPSVMQEAEAEAAKSFKARKAMKAAFENAGKSHQCHFHVGYLNERSEKGQVPDDCLVCKDIVNCMLGKTRE